MFTVAAKRKKTNPKGSTAEDSPTRLRHSDTHQQADWLTGELELTPTQVRARKELGDLLSCIKNETSTPVNWRTRCKRELSVVSSQQCFSNLDT